MVSVQALKRYENWKDTQYSKEHLYRSCSKCCVAYKSLLQLKCELSNDENNGNKGAHTLDSTIQDVFNK